MELLDMIATERRRTANLLERLTPEQWETQSLCDAWTVRQVAGHLLLGMKVGNKKFARELAKARGNFNKANIVVSKRLAEAPTDELIADLRQHATHPYKPPGSDYVPTLTDIIVHGQDIARPLDLHHVVAPEHLEPVLSGLADPKLRLLVPRKRLQGVQFEATDMDFSLGSGPVVRGTGLDIVVWAWRANGLDRLEGDGVATLRSANS